MRKVDVVVIGAGPAGAVASCSLVQKKHSVLVIEKSHFPRFVIGESLLPQCMNALEELGMLSFIREDIYQTKLGAHFTCGEKVTEIDFSQKSTVGASETWQVKRAEFDQDLIKAAEHHGAEVLWETTVESVEFFVDRVEVKVKDRVGNSEIITCSFVMDASGYGRVLPKLLDLEKATGFADRKAIFAHFEGEKREYEYQSSTIQIGINKTQRDVWYWGIPFTNNTVSVGVICPANETGLDEEIFSKYISEEPALAKRLAKARGLFEVKSIQAYSASVKQLYGDRFVLLGNAGEFLDPVFSSGVTLAIESAYSSAKEVDKLLVGKAVDWPAWEEHHLKGVSVFKAFVEEWYSGDFQRILFNKKQHKGFKENIISILAGYVWDQENPFNRDSKRKIKSLASVCDEF
ncbi:MAG: tryptophan 7-halogenase [Lentisphaeraceae bacterium]|nr:tryptophan 7-halogenase [Lentisphaeraceae bacterium]